MRVSSFYRSTVRGGRPRGAVASRARMHLAVLAALALPATASATQWPGELSGRIVDSLTKTALGAVEVLVEPGARRTSTDASGGFHFRGLEPGSYRLSVQRLGYGRTYRDVEIQNGVVARVALELTPVALEVVGITASVTSTGGTVLLREAIVESGARTAGDALRSVSVEDHEPSGGGEGCPLHTPPPWRKQSI